MFKKAIFAATVLCAFTFQSCKKDDPDPIPVVVTAPAVTLPTSITGVDGILAAISTTTKSSGVEVTVGTAHAVFYKDKNPKNKVDAGTLKINSTETTKADDLTYYYAPTATKPKGLDVTGQVYWLGNGNSATGVPAIDDNDNDLLNIPVLGEFVIMNTTQDYNLNWVSSFGGDSVIVIIKGGSGTYKKVVASSTTQLLVNKADIAKLGKGLGSITIVNYKLQLKPFGTKMYAFLKEVMAVCSKLTVQ